MARGDKTAQKTRRSTNGRGGAGKTDECEGGDCEACKACYALLASKLEALTNQNETLRLDNELHDEKMRSLKAQIEHVVAQRDELDAQLTDKREKRKNQDEDRWALRYLTGTDALTQEKLSMFMKDVVWPNMKFLDVGWEKFDLETEDSMCSMIMEEITVPDDTTAEMYWKKVRKAAFYKFITLKSQALRKVKAGVFGE